MGKREREGRYLSKRQDLWRELERSVYLDISEVGLVRRI